MQLLRLRGRKVCDRVLRHGALWKGKNLHIRWLPGHPRHPAAKTGEAAVYAGTVASTKLDKSAVKRNRMRRRCREALRLELRGTTTIPTVQLLILPRSSSLKAPFSAIQADIRLFLSFLHARRPQAQQ